jgi:hypothetical protein
VPSNAWLQRVPAIHGANVAAPAHGASPLESATRRAGTGRSDPVVVDGPARPVPTARVVVAGRPAVRVGRRES